MDQNKPKESGADLGCTAVMIGYFALLAIGAGYEYLHPKPPLSPAEEANLWRNMLADEAKNARDCEQQVTDDYKLAPDMVGNVYEAKRACWDHWRELQRQSTMKR